MNEDLSAYSSENALIFTTPEEQVHNNLYSTMNTIINIKKDQFHNLSGNNYPKKELTNQIGSGMGIEHVGEVLMLEVFGDVTEWPDGRKIRSVEGYRCTKTGRRRRPDGTWQPATETYEFNWVNRATIDFLDDEDKEEKSQKYTFKNSPEKQKRAHLKHIEELKKFAAQRASTGADLCVIRALTGMQTSFKSGDVAKGIIIVSQIIESKEYQMQLAKARIDNARMGGITADQINNAALLLTGKTADVTEDLKKNEKPPVSKTKPEEKKEPPVKKDPPGLKEQFEEMKDIKGIDKLQPPYDEYEKTVKENNYSEAVLTWAITEIMEQLGGIN